MITESHALYGLLIAVAIGLEHATFGKWWKHNELARWTMGVATVMALAYGLVLFAGLDFWTWLWILFGFGAAGITKVGLVIQAHANTRQRELDELERVRNGEDTTGIL